MNDPTQHWKDLVEELSVELAVASLRSREHPTPAVVCDLHRFLGRLRLLHPVTLLRLRGSGS